VMSLVSITSFLRANRPATTFSFVLFSSSKDPAAAAAGAARVEGEEEEERFGISYIGQDVCGSKYNDDPFSEQKNKPDAWTLMKERIRAEEARLASETNSTLFDSKTKHPGQWP